MGEPIEAFGGRKWGELEVLEHDAGQLMFPAELRRRDKTGATKITPVRVRVPNADDLFKARAQARKECKARELDEKEDRDLFRQIEQLVILSFAIRTHAAPHSQFAKFDELLGYDEGCLRDIQEQINRRKEELDPRESLTTEEEVWKAIVETARRMDTSPLADIAGRDQHALVVRMAVEACRSPTASSWLQSFGISIPESSASPSSNGS
jgi:hypothetical protein